MIVLIVLSIKFARFAVPRRLVGPVLLAGSGTLYRSVALERRENLLPAKYNVNPLSYSTPTKFALKCS